jgi:AraC-like DNA-binding protein
MRNLIYQEYTPNDSLTPFVKSYWTISAGGRFQGIANHGVVPGGHTDIVFNLGQQILHQETGKIFVQSRSGFLVGPIDSFRLFRANGQFEFLGIRFHPGKVPVSSAVPLNHARNRAVPLSTLASSSESIRRIQNVNDLLGRISTIRERIDCVEEFLMTVCSTWKEPDPVVSCAIQLIEQSRGRIPIAVLASSLEITERQLERKFAQHVGLSPKAFCRVIRFARAKSLISKMPGFADVHVAYACGYSDQTHLIREFKLFTGQTPSCYERSNSVGFFLYNL